MKLLQTLALAAMCLLCAACVKELPFEPPAHESKLVLNAFVDLDTNWYASLSSSAPASGVVRFEPVQQAEWKIWENDIPLAIEASYLPPAAPPGLGLFRLEGVVPRAGAVYRLEVHTPDFPAVAVHTRMPAAIPLGQLEWLQVTSRKVQDSLFFVQGLLRISFTDPASDSNFYALHLYYPSPVKDTQPLPVDTVNGLFLNPVFFDTADPSAIFSLAAGQSYLYEDDLFNGQTKVSVLEIATLVSDTASRLKDLVVELRHLSPDYYRYHRSYMDQYLTVSQPFAEPLQVYSNVSGGYGIFAAYAASRKRIAFP